MVQIQDGISAVIDSLRAGRLDQAQKTCKQVLSQWPGHALSWHLLGVIEHQRAHYDQAITHFKRAIELDGAREGWHFALGVSYRMVNRRTEAIAAYRRALELNPHHADAHNNLGSLLLEMGNRDQAAACFKRAIAAHRGHAGAHANMGMFLVESGQAESGIKHLRIACHLKSMVTDYHCALGRVLQGQHLLDEAAKCYLCAVRLDPQCAEAQHGLGVVRQEQGHPRKALVHFRSALQIESSVHTYRSMGAVFARLGQFERAATCFERALQRQPHDAETIAAQARLDEVRGQVDQAWQRLKPLLKAGVQDVSVAMVFAAISRHIDRQDEAIALLKKLLAGPIYEPRLLMPLHFGLGKLLDEQGHYDAAFEQFREANALKPRRFDTSKHRRFIDSMIKTFDHDTIARLARSSLLNDRPVFIIGMPRSGTSLVEQILSSHPQIHGAGELQDILRMAERLPKMVKLEHPYPVCVTGLDTGVADTLAGEYLDHLRALAPDARCVTDKLPGNFLHLGLISRLFPGARIVHCRRDPIDTCLSCYFQNFTADHGYAYNLEHLGFYYRQYERLMHHWFSVVDNPILVVHYEQLVRDTKPTVQAMLEFCSVPWDDVCLHFYESGRPVTTASYDQVRRPPYTTSIGRWRHYARYLQPLRTALGSATVGSE